MVTNTISQVLPASFDWLRVVQAISAVFAAIGTVAAVIVSLYLAWRNREQFRMTTRLNVLPTLIEQAESAARQLERNGLFFPRGGCGISWNPPTEINALQIALQNLENMEVEDTKKFTYVVEDNAFHQVTQSESAQDRIATRMFLVPVVQKLIQLRKEFELLADKTRIIQ